tara:strand:+ start:1194 stop:1895 length:702 start_codon:yes stop_codon:yes gene_type:complete
MSQYVDREWFYYLRGRELLLYKLLGGSTSERITQAGVFKTQQNELMYPDENIENGLRIEYTALNEPFVKEALESTTGYTNGTGIAFGDGTAVMTDSNSGFRTEGREFEQGDKIRIQGSSSNDGDYTLSSSGTVNAGTLTITGGTFTLEASGERITVTQIPLDDSSPSETSHPNLNRMLSLALVDYLKAMEADKMGDIERKEYYMKEFYGKLGDNESNKRNISMTFPSGPFAVR